MSKVDIDFIALLLVSVVGLAVPAIFFLRIARRFRISPFRWSLSAAYLLYLIIFFTWFNMNPPSTIAIQTLIPVALALPSSLLTIPFTRMGGDIAFWISLGCFGSIQYFLIGLIVEKITMRRRDANKAHVRQER